MRGKAEGDNKIGCGKDLNFYSVWEVKSLEGVELRGDRAAMLRIDCWETKGEEEIMGAYTRKW